MQLIPKAKPVRFRIASGGNECRDLDSLLRSFSIDDIKKIEKKQLIKWLNQVNKGKAIAEKLNKEDGLEDLDYYKIFYGLQASNLFEVCTQLKNKWSDSAKILEEKELGEGDFEFVKKYLENADEEVKIEYLKDEQHSQVIRKNSKYFFDICKDIYNKGSQRAGLLLLAKLQSYGNDFAKRYLKELNSKNYKGQKATTNKPNVTVSNKFYKQPVTSKKFQRHHF